MIDFAKIKIIAGEGGNGVGSFFRTRAKRLGKANGGDAGRGGNVYLLASRDLNTLEPFRYVKEYRAKRGENGLSNNRKGAEGEDLFVKVPVGTLVKVTDGTEEPKEPQKNKKPLAHPAPLLPLSSYDLVEEGQKVLIARGGEGGRGNAHLRDEYGRRPMGGQKGEQGEEVDLTLELKLIADVGLIGLPNAGKSTLLAQVTKAHPVVAPYPFTTLEPNLGVLNGSQFTVHSSQKKANLVFADIPGLIEGASEGKGLGHLFLRHIERTRVLVHLIDVSAPNDPIEAYKTVKNELKTYSIELAKKKEIIALNKIDLVSKDQLEEVVGRFKKMRKTAVAISAKGGIGLDELISRVNKTLTKV